MQDRLGFLGTVFTIGTGLLGWVSAHEAELRAVSFAMSAGVGVLTLAWWIKRWCHFIRVWSNDSDPADKD